MTFLEYLLHQQDRDDPIGTLACCVGQAYRAKKGRIQDKGLPPLIRRSNDRAAWYDYLQSINAGNSVDVGRVLNDALREFESLESRKQPLVEIKTAAYDLIVYKGRYNSLWPCRPAAIIDKATGKPPRGTEILWGFDASANSFCPLPASQDIEVRVEIRDGDTPEGCN